MSRVLYYSRGYKQVQALRRERDYAARFGVFVFAS